MDERGFLDRYDPNAFARPSVAVDLILMTVVDGAPAVLLSRRDQHPFAGDWALPGGFVAIDESLDDAARRVLREKVHLSDAYVEQLYSFGAVDRDPRMRIISIAYFALLPVERLRPALGDTAGPCLARVTMSANAEVAEIWGDPGSALALAFDHAAMTGVALARLRGKLDYSDIALALLPARFTLRMLQEVYEAILGRSLNKPAFRRRMLDRGWIIATGEREEGASFRPAELYRARNPSTGAPNFRPDPIKE